MAKANTHYLKLKREYIFPIIDQKLAELQATHPKAKIITLGVGDIALPLAPAIAKAITRAVDEMTRPASMRGYGPTEGYPFLREAIAKHEFSPFGIGPDEIFISSGANEDTANILDIFSGQNTIAVADPTYPVYLDASMMSGRNSKIVLLPCTLKTGFLPKPPKKRCDLIYLCSPANPTGVAMTHKDLKEWVDYAKRHESIILYDHAYAAFVNSPNVPKSIYEIKGAKDVAIEFRSFSKSAGFTGLRCAYTVLPKNILCLVGRRSVPLHPLWVRRQAVKTNGISYPIQRGAEATFTAQGKIETEAQVDSYIAQAKTLRNGLLTQGHQCYGGTDSPYIWWKTPRSMTSWEFFDFLLNSCHIITVPGKGFGANGEGYVRVSAFTTPENAQEALNRIRKCALP